MAYATIADMIARFGEQEMVQLTTPAGQDTGGVVRVVANTALESSSARMDSYIRRRYRTPIDVPPPEIVSNCCDIARFELSTGDGKTCSDEVRDRNKTAMDWLRDMAKGIVVLDLDEVAVGDESYAQASTRRAVFE